MHTMTWITYIVLKGPPPPPPDPVVNWGGMMWPAVLRHSSTLFGHIVSRAGGSDCSPKLFLIAHIVFDYSNVIMISNTIALFLHLICHYLYSNRYNTIWYNIEMGNKLHFVILYCIYIGEHFNKMSRFKKKCNFQNKLFYTNSCPF